MRDPAGKARVSFYDSTLETLDRDIIGRKQEEGLRRLLAVLEGNPFYRPSWRPQVSAHPMCRT